MHNLRITVLQPISISAGRYIYPKIGIGAGPGFRTGSVIVRDYSVFLLRCSTGSGGEGDAVGQFHAVIEADTIIGIANQVEARVTGNQLFEPGTAFTMPEGILGNAVFPAIDSHE